METEVLYIVAQETTAIMTLQNVTDVEFAQGMVLFYNKKTILLGVPQDRLIHFENKLKECIQ